MTEHPYDQLMEEVRADLSGATNPSQEEAESRLGRLQEYREHGVITRLAEKYLSTWPDAFKIMKFFAQALIESGHALAAEGFIKNALEVAKKAAQEAEGQITQELSEKKEIETVELYALIGRCQKDLFQKAVARDDHKAAEFHIQAAWNAYKTASEVRTRGRYYPLINLAAVAQMARLHSVHVEGDPNPRTVAEDVIEALKEEDANANWVQATVAEAHIPLGNWDQVEESLNIYLDAGPTPFQHNSTLRQFRDVWRLEDRGPRGKAILALLQSRAIYDNKECSGDYFADIPVHAGEIGEELDVRPEKMLGDDGMQPWEWYCRGGRRAASVAAILKRSGKRVGTAFVIDADDFGLAEKAEGRACLMTNYHVLNKHSGSSPASPSSGSKVRFEAAANPEDRKKEYRVLDVLFESPLQRTPALPGQLDCTIFTIDADANDLQTIPIEFDFVDDPKNTPTPRVYIIGYPLGGEMQFSLQDNRLLDHECSDCANPEKSDRRRVHYFAPTEPGNSGSPVFDDGWNCIALHHGGRKHGIGRGENGLPKLNQKGGRHSANQGIWMGSIRAALKP